MNFFYDPRDDHLLTARGLRLLYWLDDLGARPIGEAAATEEGFLFAGARSIEDYHKLVTAFPKMRDRPEERRPLLRLDDVLTAMEVADDRLPTPRTWRLDLDRSLPEDLRFPLFVRTARSSWKLGGSISKVTSVRELAEEAAELRRAFGWDATILVREWLDLAPAGDSMYGPVPQEVRVWIVDQRPVAWSFHHLSIVDNPSGFPPSEQELGLIAQLASRVGQAFRSRCVAADFAKCSNGDWVFLEAGPGSCAGTSHEEVFKAMAMRLQGEAIKLVGDRVGGPLFVQTT